MATVTREELRFLATPEKGEVSALLVRPANASHVLVLGHGASTNMRHATLENIAECMAGAGIATFRYNFPYTEHGKGRDSEEVCTSTIRSAVAAAHQAAIDLPVLAGGHSFGGRMTSTAASQMPLDRVCGLVFFAFPLHQPGKPDTKRAHHLDAVTLPMLFLSGTRDDLADWDLLRTVCKKLGKRATLHPLETADHGFRVLKRSRQSDEDVFVEMARVARDWASKIIPFPASDRAAGTSFAWEDKSRISQHKGSETGDMNMPRGDKSKYTEKQKRKAEHIEEGYEKRGVPEKEAASRAWATVNKESGGGNKSGSGRDVPDTHESSEKGGRIGGAASASRSAAERSASAKKAAATRKRNKAAKA
jgi:uncharacterized protein